jgi:4-hydroxy 2-oxovalerate aldolase
MSKIIISDPTLRDGNHAVQHNLNARQIAAYCTAADAAGVPVVEVGHGNGLGASSLQVGESALSDEEILTVARTNLRRSKLGIHVIPGFATVNNHLRRALELGVNVVRVASHCTEADTTQRHIGFVREQGQQAFGVLMMSHMAAPTVLVEEARKMESYGAEAVIIMDSAGTYLPDMVRERITSLSQNLGVAVGFHAHNNLGMSIANSLAAVESGALMVDGTARGFGAGAGNAQLEVLVAVLERCGYDTGIDLYKILDAAEVAERELMPRQPAISSVSIVSGLAGVFSGFSKHVERVAREFAVDPRDIFFELGKRKVVAGQEDMIVQVGMQLADRKRDPELGSRA